MIADHYELESLIAAYTLGVADAQESAAVRSHLSECSSCRELAARLQNSVDALPLGAPAANPPAGLRDRILSEAGAAAPPRAEGPPARSRPPALGQPLGRWRPAGARGMAAAAAVAAFVLGAALGYALATHGRPSPPPEAHYMLTGSGPMAAARGQVTDLRSQGVTVVRFTGLPQPGPGRVDELWLIDARGRPQPGAVFMPDTSGAHTVLLPRSVEGLKALAVTEENGPDGAPAPTQQPQLIGNIK
jgi:anti-sigma-K factor RskA